MASVAVLGGGNGGFAAAVHLTVAGHQVNHWMRSSETAGLVADSGITHSGVLGEGCARPALVTNDLREAIAGVDLILICVPATAFSDVAAGLGRAMDGNIPVLLNPGNTGGALAFRQMLRASGCRHVPVIGETNTLTYICRKQAAGEVRISSLVRNVRVAALPAAGWTEVARIVMSLYPSARPVPTVLHTSLSNVNAILHPPGVVLSAAWIEATGGDFTYYYDAATPSVARMMAALDEERLAVASAWDIKLESFPSLFADIGSTSEDAGRSGSFLRMLKESEPNKFIKAPPTVDHRYFHEDIPFGLFPLGELGRLTSTPTPQIDAMVTISSTITGVDYRVGGWNAVRLGLSEGRYTSWQSIRDV